jgi:large repetitive protein
VTVTSPPPNAPPVADFTAEATALTVSVDASALSSDPDGTVADYAWSFGDGGTDSGGTAVHTYAAAGTYDITLTVTDDDGASTSAAKSVTVQAPPPVNTPPTATFTATATGLAIALDGTGSTDPDGTIASHTWDFGDGSSGAGVTASHTYAAAGNYTVKLTVVDDDGALGESTKQVTINAPGPQTFATDTFARVISNAWGPAEAGGNWTTSNTASLFAVNNGRGTITMPNAGSSPTIYLNGVSARDVNAVADVSFDKAGTGGGIFSSLIVRRDAASNSDYRLRLLVRPTQTFLQITRIVNGVETQLTSQAVNGLVVAPGDVIRMRLQALGAGSTTLSGKIWRATDAEPTAWQVTAQDSTAGLQNVGGVGINDYLSGSATNAPVQARHDNLSVTAIP